MANKITNAVHNMASTKRRAIKYILVTRSLDDLGGPKPKCGIASMAKWDTTASGAAIRGSATVKPIRAPVSE